MVGSWIESLCASIYICSQISSFQSFGWGSIYYPFYILSSGIIVTIITSGLATGIDPATRPREVELTLRLHLIVTSILMIPFILAISFLIVPESFDLTGISHDRHITVYGVTTCVIVGLFGALINGLISKEIS